MTDLNEALWLRRPTGRLRVGPAPMPQAGPGELVVQVRAIAVNPVDAIPGLAHRVVTPWLRYPTILGSDVSGDVVATGAGVRRIAVGDRVLAHAAGQERSRNRPTEGAFQRFAVVLERMTSPIPDGLSSAQAAVLPLALSTAAAGLFEPSQLGLQPPRSEPRDTEDVVLVWGASTSVGSNAVQLARNAGYRVLATASERNSTYVRTLGAEEVADYHDRSAEHMLTDALAGRRLVGSLAIGAGSLSRVLRVVRDSDGSRRVASAYPTPTTRIRSLIAQRYGVAVTAIWGGSPVDSTVGPMIYRDFLPTALADKRYLAAPEAMVVGRELAAIPEALARLRRGVSARKLVVVL